ncbi:MAG: hypothetical protein HY661_13665 [Betaproteobacteria bacterium]|nr:hypothetical protein [Betaproteobacteria bacterium]
MASKEEVIKKITIALNEKAGGQQPCVVCGKTQWLIVDQFVTMTVAKEPNAVRLGGASMPLVPLVCTNCGNTHLLNLLVLGFSDLSALKIDDDADTKS